VVAAGPPMRIAAQRSSRTGVELTKFLERTHAA